MNQFSISAMPFFFFLWSATIFMISCGENGALAEWQILVQRFKFAFLIIFVDFRFYAQSLSSRRIDLN